MPSTDSTIPSPAPQLAAEWGLAALVFAALSAWHGGSLLLHGQVPSDERLIHLGNLAFNWNTLHAGVLPLWNPYQFGGIPQLASNFAAALYPPGYFFFALWPPFRAFSLMQTAHFWWLALGVWAWLRRDWGMTTAAALIGGAAFAFSGFAVAHEGHAPMLWALSWSPWILWQTHRAILGRKLAIPILAAGLAFQIGAGYMQISVMTWMVAGCEALVLARISQAGGALRLIRPLLGGFLGLGLMSVQFLATREFLPFTPRLHLDFETFAGRGFSFGELPRLFFPLLFGAATPGRWIAQANFGRWELSEVTGAMPGVAWIGLLLAAWLLTRPGAWNSLPNLYRRRIVYWCIVGLFAFSMIFGPHSPLAPLLFHLPLYNKFRIQTRWLGFFDLATAALAAIGFDRFFLRLPARNAEKGAMRFILAGLFACVSLPPALRLWMKLFPPDVIEAGGRAVAGPPWFQAELTLNNPAIWVPILFIALAPIGLLLASRRPHGPALAAALWLVLIGGEMKFVGQRVSLQSAWPSEQATPPGNRAVVWMRERQSGPDDLFRVLPVTGDDIFQTPETLIQHLASLDGVDSLLGDWQLVLPDCMALLRLSADGSTRDPEGLLLHPWILSMMNCRYLLAGYAWDGRHIAPFDPAAPQPEFLRRLASDPQRYPSFRIRERTAGGATIVENASVLPRAWTVGRLESVASSGDAIARLWQDDPFDPRGAAMVEQSAGLPPLEANGPLESARISVERLNPNHLRLTVSPPVKRAAFVVLSEPWLPGWWARSGSRFLPIYRTDAVLRGFFVGPDDTQIDLSYLPDGVKRGGMLSLGFALAWIGSVAAETFRRRRRSDLA